MPVLNVLGKHHEKKPNIIGISQGEGHTKMWLFSPPSNEPPHEEVSGEKTQDITWISRKVIYTGNLGDDNPRIRVELPKIM